MLAKVRELVSLLASDPLTVKDVAATLGTIARDDGGTVEVAPADPSLQEVTVARGIDIATRTRSDEPGFVWMVPTEALTLSSLAEAFGSYREIPREERDRLPQAIFYIKQTAAPCLVTLIADVRDGEAVSLTLRRDKLP